MQSKMLALVVLVVCCIAAVGVQLGLNNFNKTDHLSCRRAENVGNPACCPDDGDPCTAETITNNACHSTPIAGCCIHDADCAPLGLPSVAVCMDGKCVACTDHDYDGAECEPEGQFCSDGLDNDGNGAVDCRDVNCAGSPACDGTEGDSCMEDVDCQLTLECHNFVCGSRQSDIGITFSKTHGCSIGWATKPGVQNYQEELDLVCRAWELLIVPNALYVTWYPANNEKWWTTMTDEDRMEEINRLGCNCVHPDGNMYECILSATSHTVVCML